MKIQAIIVDEMPECCAECSLFSYNEDGFSYCAGLSDAPKKEFDLTPYLDMHRRGDCPLITLKGIESEIKNQV